MTVLGISDNHDSGACLIREGRVLSAVNEERLARKKLIGGFPYRSIQKVMDEARVGPQDIDAVVLASLMTPAAILRLCEGLHDGLRRDSSSFSYLLNAYIIYQVLADKLKIPRQLESFISVRVIKAKLKELGLRVPVTAVDHHYAHAAGAYYTGGFDTPALIITADAMGDALSVTVNIGKDKVIQRVFSQSGFSAISTYYSRLTEFLGFRPVRHEGKITSLAGYGRSDPQILELAENQLRFVAGKKAFNLKNHFFPEAPDDRWHKKLKAYSPEDIAYNFQKNFEDQIVRFVQYWISRTGLRNLGLSGGAFANVSLNRRISRINEVEKLYVFPHMGDGGLSLGAGLAFLKPDPFYFEHIYFGPEYGEEEIKKAISGRNIAHTFFEEEALCARIAGILSQGKTVAHFNGKMEYGPRALGNRSILYRADDPDVLHRLNNKLKRTDFMPFAPVTADSESDRLYTGTAKIEYTLRFMNIAVDCTPEMKSKCPGAVHADGTARPQILRREDNPRLYRILRAYKDLKGTSTVINTSFNKHEEPIVCSPEDAVRSFLECELDCLVLNNFLIWKKTI